MKVRLVSKRGLVHNCTTPKAWAVKMSGRMVFVPKSKSVLTPVESSKYLNCGEWEYKHYDLIVANGFLQGKDDLIETLTDIYHYNKMYNDNTTDIPYTPLKKLFKNDDSDKESEEVLKWEAEQEHRQNVSLGIHDDYIERASEVDYERKAFDDLATYKERHSYD